MNSALQKISPWLLRATIVLWSLYVLFDYFAFHPYYFESISENPFWSIGIGYLILAGGAIAAIRYFKMQSVRGWMIYSWIVFIMLFLIAIYGSSIPLFKSSTGFHLAQAMKNIVFFHFPLLILLTCFYSIGNQAIKPFSKIITTESQSILSIAFGMSVIAFFLVILGLAGQINMISAGILILAGIGIFYKSSLQFLKNTFTKKINFTPSYTQLFAFFILTFFIAFNLVGMFKAFPKGYDGANLYLNISHLIAGDGGLAVGGGAANWSVLMSLGEVIFGSPTISIHISQAAGILAVIALYRLARLVLARDYALLSAALFYAMPLVAYHSRMDEKVDLGYLFAALALILFLGEYFLNKKDAGDKIAIQKPQMTFDIAALAAAGWLCGFAFGVKYLGMFLAMWLVSFLAYRKAGFRGFWGSLILFSAPAFLITGAKFNFGEHTNWDIAYTMIVFIAVGLGLLIFAFKDKLPSLVSWLKMSCVLGLLFAANYSPWLIKHVAERGSIGFSAVIDGQKPNLFDASNEFFAANNIPLKTEEQFKKQVQQETGNVIQSIGYQLVRNMRVSKREEIQRYLGYEKGLPRYLSVFYDTTMGANIQGRRYLDIGFLFLLLLPLIFIQKGNSSLWKNALVAVFTIIILLASVVGISDFINPQSLSATTLKPISQALSPVLGLLSKTSFFISLICVLLIALSSSYLLRNRVNNWSSEWKYIGIAFTSYAYLWWIMGAGIIWYAFPALALGVIFISKYLNQPEDLVGVQNSKFVYWFLTISVSIFFFFNFTASLTNYENNKVINNRLFQDRGIEQFTNTPDRKTSFEKYDPVFQQTFEAMNTRPEGKVYRVGTFFNYYIKNNDTRVFEDNQLGNFDILQKRLQNKQDFIKALKANDFKYILFDLSTGAIDVTPEQSLKKKSAAFEELLTNNKALKLLYTDNYMEAKMKSGEVKKGFGLGKATKRRGRFVLWEIL